MHWQGAETEQPAMRRGRRPWFRVRVETEDGAYVGSLRLDGPRGTLRELVDDDRAYLSLWNATQEATGSRDEFVALHKSAIRFVALLDDEGTARAARKGA
jgi:hypothetical protein